MLKPDRFPPALAFPAAVFIIIGLALAGGGGPLVILGGSWYYAITGIAIALTGVLLYICRRSALWLFALVLFGSTIWAIAEARFDFWQLLPRLWVWLLLALWLLLPMVAGKLVFGPPDAHRKGVLPLAAAVIVIVLLGLEPRSITRTIGPVRWRRTLRLQLRRLWATSTGRQPIGPTTAARR